jgi:hypothetical protein
MTLYNAVDFQVSVPVAAQTAARKIKTFYKIAKSLLVSDASAFVPCWGTPQGKKAPCSGADKWQQGEIGIDALEDFPTMEMLALVLGNKFLAVDADGASALALLERLAKEHGLTLPAETLQVSSNLGTRHCWFFAIPDSFEGQLEYFKIDTGDAEQLEFRTGLQYQIVAGIHPKTKQPYLTNSKPIFNLDTPWLTFLTKQGKKPQALANVPTSKPAISKPPINTPVNRPTNQGEYVFPPTLYAFVSQETKSFLRQGAIAGGRNVASFNAACDLLGTAAKLDSLGIKYVGDPEKLYLATYDKLDTRDFTIEEFEKTWESAYGKDRTCAKDDEILLSIAGLWEEEVSGFESGIMIEEIDVEEFEDKIEQKLKFASPTFENRSAMIAACKLANPNMTVEEVVWHTQAIYLQLGNKGFGGQSNSIWAGIYKELTAIDPTEQDKAGLATVIKHLKVKRDCKLDVDYFVNKSRCHKKTVIEHIVENARLNKVNESHSLISLLVTLTSLMPKNLKFSWNGVATSFRPNIFCLLVAPPSYGKDEIFGAITKPLHSLSIKANNDYLDAVDHAKRLMGDWNDIPKNERKEMLNQYARQQGKFTDEMSTSELRALYFEMNGVEEEPKKSHPFILNQPSLQNIAKVSGEHTRNGLLLNPSEIADFFSNANRINGDKNGADGLIALWNGANTNSELKSKDLQQKADYYQLCVLSGIQPGRFGEYIKKEDPSGIASRFIYLNMTEPVFKPTISYDDALASVADFDLESMYLDFQNTLNNQVPVIEELVGQFKVERINDVIVRFRTASQAIATLDGYRTHCNNKAMTLENSNPAAFQWYRRLAENVVKFAFVLHALRFYYGLEKDIKYISDEAMTQAVMIGHFLEAQYEDISDVILQNKTQLTDDDILIYEKMLTACQKVAAKKNQESVKTSDIANEAILRSKEFLALYCKHDKDAKYMKKAEIMTCWKSMTKLGLGVLDAATGAFTPAKI